MKAKFIFKKDGTVELGTIEGVSGMTCSKKAQELKQLLPGAVAPGEMKKTNEFHKTQEGKQDLHVG